MSSGGRKTVFSGADEADVDALLRAAEDEINLKLHTNSHLVSTSPSLDADLTRRFDALKKPQPPVAPPCQDDREGDDLEARFAKLKGLSGTGDVGLGLDPASESGGSGIRHGEGDEEVDVEKEVDKLMQWAKDAVRLDAIKGEKEEEGEKEQEAEEEKEEEEEKSSDDENEEDEDDVKGKAKKPKKWFIF